MAPFVLRRLKADVLQDMPPKQDELLLLKLEARRVHEPLLTFTSLALPDPVPSLTLCHL